jgi:predicted esterase
MTMYSHGAGAGNRVAMTRDPAIRRAEQEHHSRQMRGICKWPGARNLFRKIDESVCATMDCATGGEHAQLIQQFFA